MIKFYVNIAKNAIFSSHLLPKKAKETERERERERERKRVRESKL